MASQLIEVCNILVGYTYGDLTRQIFTCLAKNGRIPFDVLKRSYFPTTHSRRVKHSLTQLIQYRIVLHHTENLDTEQEIAYYSVDWHTAFGLIRNGRVIAMVEDRNGMKAATVVAMLLQIGHTTVGDLVSAFNFDESTGVSKRDSGIDAHVNGNGAMNGVHKSQAKDDAQIGSVAELHHILRKLLESRFLMKVGSRSFKPQADVEAEVEELIFDEQFPDRKVTGPKKQAEFRRSVDSLKRKWRDEAEYSGHRDIESNGIIKRPGMDAMNAQKRQKLNGGLSNGINHSSQSDYSGPKLPNDMSISVNLAKCIIAMRSENLVQYARQYLGHVTAGVYKALLVALEGKVSSVRDDLVHYEDEDEEEEAQPVASVMEVAAFIDPELDIAASIKGAKSGLPNGGPKAKKKGKIEYDTEFADIGIKREIESDDEDTVHFSSLNQGKRVDLIEQHLKLLEEHEKEFCRRPGSAGQSEWRVNFPLVTQTLINAEIDKTIHRRFGHIAVRIARMLREEGRLEEKLVAQKTLKHVKDIRAILGQMQAAGFLESQEVPRDNYRQPTRSLYLWFFDEKKVQQLVLQQSYQCMARCLQRMDVEQERFQQILDKRARLRKANADDGRSFIMGKTGLLEEEGAPLSGVEKQQLAQWREVQEKLLAQVGRIDDLIAVMRDFSGKDVSMIS